MLRFMTFMLLNPFHAFMTPFTDFHRKLGPPPTPHRPNDWALSQAALARRAMIASRVSSLAAESERNAAMARCRAIGKGDNADVVSRRGDAVLSAAGAGLVRDHGPSGQFSFEPLRARDGFGLQLQQQGLAIPREATLRLQGHEEGERAFGSRPVSILCFPVASDFLLVVNNLNVRHLNFLQECHDTARTAD